MQFHPETLLRLAERSGLKIQSCAGYLVVTTPSVELPQPWAEALRRHKHQLLPRVPELCPPVPR